MNKPSNKLLSLGITFVICLTILGILITANSYRQTQKHALEMGENQLAKINDSAIKILRLEIKAYTLALEDYASNIFNETNYHELIDDPQVQKNLLYKTSAAAGLFLISPEGTLLSSRDIHSDQFTNEKITTIYVDKDPLYQEAIQGSIKQNGEAYFIKNTSYVNLYRPVYDKNQVLQSILVLPINLEELYQQEIDTTENQNGYTMIKNEEMKVIMHPSTEQIGLDIVEDRRKKFPDLDYSDLEDLEKVQLANEKGTLSYSSYWWTKADPKKVLKISAYEWITIGEARWIVASSSDFYERNGMVLQENLIILGLLAILLAIVILLGVSFSNYNRQNKIYLENLQLVERQEFLKERHELEKNMLQKSKLETVGLLTTTIVHDMNNFLTPMIGNLQLLIEEYQSNNTLITELSEVYQAAEKGQKLSANVLRFTKSSTAAKGVYSIDKVVLEAIETMKILVPKSVTLLYNAKPAGNSFFEKNDLQVILYNLITNAYQAQMANALIEVQLSMASGTQLENFQNHSLAYREKQFAQINVIDNGPGIPKEIEEKMFTPFFTTKTGTDGTGLGLFIVSSIIKKNDWLLEVKNTDTGTTFIIGIPLAEDFLLSN
ncbi:GHKL domain-containing protein [Enterococcus sp. BWB1-3]|uniref:sensor histidine kinase n=1 Tax=unclassified Enterococcus TaxID=2608891 RepID=UPI001921006E|nr:MULTISPECIES: cache domain-containing protein [unclassified Enterococcus]MBL1230961.1 GHKL domain-containing protein [Enterococcus sp. BWB1-3]MCB5953286.1 GHKL domain-containing protein [Enterococcus sp. BWT-B8]MCB5955730.1 GHKL domain-containing protein [Enterococcus sp. CWB-B31]